MKTSESSDNLTWLQPGETYVCIEPLVLRQGAQDQPSLQKARTYRYESFSSDPLGDTRQYLFTDLQDERAYGVELPHDLQTPQWNQYLEPR